MEEEKRGVALADATTAQLVEELASRSGVRRSTLADGARASVTGMGPCDVLVVEPAGE